MQGRVTCLEAHVDVPARSPSGAPARVVRFVVDTGFVGALTMPAALVADLGLPYLQTTRATLADGTRATIDTYVAEVVWDGVERSVAVLSMDSRALLGTALLDRHELVVQFVDGGIVTVGAL